MKNPFAGHIPLVGALVDAWRDMPASASDAIGKLQRLRDTRDPRLATVPPLCIWDVTERHLAGRAVRMVALHGIDASDLLARGRREHLDALPQWPVTAIPVPPDVREAALAALENDAVPSSIHPALWRPTDPVRQVRLRHRVWSRCWCSGSATPRWCGRLR